MKRKQVFLLVHRCSIDSIIIGKGILKLQLLIKTCWPEIELTDSHLLDLTILLFF